MQGLSHTRLAGDIAGAMAWWKEAGVDCAFADEPLCWIAEPDELAAVPQPRLQPAQQTFAPPPSPDVPRIDADRSAWPGELDAFRAWWMAEPALDGGRVAGRIAPRGNAGADVMVLVEQPEAEDRETLLSGPQGELLGAMLSAMGIAPENAYFASVLTRHTPMPDWPALGAAGIGAVLAHHIHLAAPKRLIAFGGNILPLLGNDPAQSAQSLPQINHEGRTIPVIGPLLGAHGLEALLRPSAKAGFWQRWLDWTGATSA